MSNIFVQHQAGCTPVEPCLTCKAMAFLRLKLSPGDYEEFSRLITEVKSENNSVLRKSIVECEFSRRTENFLTNYGLGTLGDIVAHNEAEILAMPNSGRKTLDEIKSRLKYFGLALAQRPEQGP